MTFAQAEKAITGGPWKMGQGWAATLPAGFKAAKIRYAWEPDALWILADLPDDYITTRSTADNQDMWTLGDVFEIFVERQGARKYAELHVTPKNHRLHLLFPHGAIEKIRRDVSILPSFKQSPVGFESRVRRPRGRAAWQVLVKIPAKIIFPGKRFCEGVSLNISFSRYDYGRRGQDPVLSSTSPHRRTEFHNRPDWRGMILMPWKKPGG